MLAAASTAIADCLSRPFRWAFIKTITLTLALLVVLIIAIEAVFGTYVGWPDWIETTVQVLGGFALVVGSVFLIPAISSLVAGLFLDGIAETVEKRHYPNEPVGHELSLVRSVFLAAKFLVVVIAVNVVVLFLLLLPGVNVVAFFIANGYLLGREFFELAALRHMPLKEVHALRKRHFVRVFVAGLLIAGFVAIPIVNLLTPLFATSFMVHVYKGIAHREAARAARRR